MATTIRAKLKSITIEGREIVVSKGSAVGATVLQALVNWPAAVALDKPAEEILLVRYARPVWMRDPKLAHVRARRGDDGSIVVVNVEAERGRRW